MPTSLLTTKFFIPSPPPGDLPRPRLFGLLDEVLSPGKRLGLICAPAGYGKTSLVADWIRALKDGRPGQPIPAAWLSLEESENDPEQFLLYLTASLQRALPANPELELLAQSVTSAAPQAILAGLVNQLAAQPGPVLLVLDDYQVIRAPSIHADLAFFIEHLPPNAHLVITTRSDPALPLHRYRARGQVVEIRLAELRLSADEVGSLLSNENRADLGPAEANLLTERTEGWPAGMHMAMLSLRGKPDAREFLHAWTGGQRYILDYLAEEVLHDQPPKVQQFLVQTAVLDRLCAELCGEVVSGQWPVVSSEVDATVLRDERPVTSEESSSFLTDHRPLTIDHSPDHSRHLLDTLYSSNLFLIPLDEEGRWFRYHHLFLDLLRVRLKQLAPEVVAGLHRRAARWLEANGWLREAIQHDIQAGDFESAAALVEQHTFRLFSEGELQSLVAWIRVLPGDLAASRPWLRVYQAWALGFAGKLPEAMQMCQAVEALLANSEFPEAQRNLLQANLIGIRALTGLMAGNIAAVLALEALPADRLPPGSEFARSAIHWALGYAWRMQGRLQEALSAFQEMRRLGLEMNNNWTIISASVDLGAVLRLTGRLREAEAVYRDGLRRVQQAGLGGIGFVGRLESFLANALFDKNELEEAEKLALSSIRHNRYWENPNHTAHGYATLARIRLAQADLPGAEEAFREAARTAEDPSVVPTLKVMIAAQQVRLWLAQGDLIQITRWLEAHQEETANPAYLNTEMGQVLGLICARARLASGDETGALALLAQLEVAARRVGQTSALVEVRAVQAHTLPSSSDRRAALIEALALGFPEGCVRAFLDEGEALLQELAALPAWLKRERPTAVDTRQLTAWAETLLAQFPTQEEPETALSNASPLTDRELEILRAIAEGLSNQEIGKRLYISAGTVKAHSAAIYRKLDVANRTEAIAKAKDNGWV